METSTDSIIRNHAMMASAAGLIPIPILDLTTVTGIQMDMMRQLYKYYDRDFEVHQGKAQMMAFLGNLGFSLTSRLIPGFWFIRKGALCAIYGGLTYALGQAIVKFLESGEKVPNFQTAQWKEYFQEQFEKGKTYFNKGESWFKWNKDSQTGKAYIVEEEVFQTDPDTEVMNKLEELAKLKDKGVISEEEFQSTKTRLLEQL